MKTSSESSDRSTTKYGTAPTPVVWSVREHGPLPARALGPKARTLHLRRQQRRPQRLTGESADSTQSVLTGADAALTIVLAHARSGLFVQRTQRTHAGVRLIQSMVFHRRDEFLRWCHADPLRFADPKLHRRVHQRGADFFDARP